MTTSTTRGILPLTLLSILPVLAFLSVSQTPPAVAQEEADPAPEIEPERVLIYPIEDEITGRMYRRMKADVDRYIAEDNVRDVVFELNTPGGDLQAGLDMSAYIYGLEDRDVRTYGYVPRDAIALSAGTMLATACQTLVMGKNAQIGDVQPINALTFQELPEKIQTHVRSSLRSYATARGYPIALVEAMVTKELEVLRIEGLDESGNPFEQFLTKRDFEILDAETKNRIDKKKIASHEGQLLTLTSEEALDYGFISHIISERSNMLNTFGLTGDLISHGEVGGAGMSFDGSGWLAVFNHPFAKFLMILIGVLGIVIELKAPGLGFPGLIGVAAFAVFFVAGGMAGTVGTVEILLFVSALLLLAAEIFLIPGFGVAGVLGLAFMLSSLTLSLMSGTGQFQKDEVLPAAQVVIYSVAGSIVLVLAVINFLPRSRRLVKSGLISTAVLDKAAAPTDTDEHGFPTASALVGKPGIALTALRPAGKVEIDGVVHDVVADGEFLGAGAKVTVSAVEGHRIVVESVEE